MDGIILNGTMGENGWYISPVVITFDDENGTWVHCFVKIDGGDWFEYTGPIIVNTDGIHTVYYYYIDHDGNVSPTYSAMFKIDMTPPTLEITVHRIGPKIGVTMNASDDTSGVGLFEFYLDGGFVGRISTPPYEFMIWIGPGVHTVKVIVYNGAGLNASSSVTTPYNLCFMQNNILRQRFFQLLHNLFLYYQIFSGKIQN
jgi:hypothetical protein